MFICLMNEMASKTTFAHHAELRRTSYGPATNCLQRSRYHVCSNPLFTVTVEVILYRLFVCLEEGIMT
jgi:hypothetical protein